ncbi:MAG: hypothetical protein V7K36_26060 [Nostoc sp.]
MFATDIFIQPISRAIFAIQNLNWYQPLQVQVKLIQQPYLHGVELIISH